MHTFNKKKTSSSELLNSLQDRFLLRFGTVANGYVVVPGRLKLLGYDLYPSMPTLGMTIDACLHVLFSTSEQPSLQFMMPGYPIITLDPLRLDVLPNEYNTPIALLKIIVQTITSQGFSIVKGLKLFVHSTIPSYGNFAYSTALIVAVVSALVPSFFTFEIATQIALIQLIEKRIPNYRFHPHDALMILQPGFHHGYWLDEAAKSYALPTAFFKSYVFSSLKLPKKTTVQPWEWMIPTFIQDFFLQEKRINFTTLDSLWLANHHQRLLDTYGKKTVEALMLMLDEQRRIIQSMIRCEQEDWVAFSKGLLEQEQQRLSLLVDTEFALQAVAKRKGVLSSITPEGYWMRTSLNEEDIYLGWHRKDAQLKMMKMLHRHFPNVHVSFFRVYDKKLKIVHL